MVQSPPLTWESIKLWYYRDMSNKHTSEAWRPVVGWESLYEVSTNGRVRSTERKVAFGKQTRLVPPRILHPGNRLDGTLYVNLSGNKKRATRAVHHLVLEAFLCPRPPGLEGAHWDDDKTNNHIENLRWTTRSGNMRDMVRNGNHHQTLKTRCPAGHEYTPENTKVGRNGGRWCRECHRIDGRERYQRDIENQRAYKREQQRRSRAKRKA